MIHVRPAAIPLAMIALAMAAPATSAMSAASDSLPGGAIDRGPSARLLDDTVFLSDVRFSSVLIMHHGDLDGDGRLELIVGNARPDDQRLVVVRRSGDRFGLPRDVPITGRPIRPSAVDLDGDGDDEILTLGRTPGGGSTGVVSAVFDTAAGGFVEAWTLPALTGTKQVAVRQRPDSSRAVVVPSGDAGITIWTLDEHGQPTGATEQLAEPADHAVALDVDGDGIEDLVANRRGVDALLFWYRGLPDGTLSAAAPVGPGVILDGPIAVADLDGNGLGDLLFTRQTAATDEPIRWRPSVPGGGFADERQFGSGRGGAAFVIVPGDLDGDGAMDLVVPFRISSGRSRLEVWRGDGTGTFTLAGQTLAMTDSGSAIVDLDGDGRLEHLTAGGQRLVSRAVTVHAAPPGVPGAAHGPGIQLGDDALLLQGVPFDAVAFEVGGRDAFLTVTGSPVLQPARLQMVAFDGTAAGTVLDSLPLPGGYVSSALGRPSSDTDRTMLLVTGTASRELRSLRIRPGRLAFNPGAVPLEVGTFVVAAGDFDADGDVDGILLGPDGQLWLARRGVNGLSLDLDPLTDREGSVQLAERVPLDHGDGFLVQTFDPVDGGDPRIALFGLAPGGGGSIVCLDERALARRLDTSAPVLDAAGDTVSVVAENPDHVLAIRVAGDRLSIDRSPAPGTVFLAVRTAASGGDQSVDGRAAFVAGSDGGPISHLFVGPLAAPRDGAAIRPRAIHFHGNWRARTVGDFDGDGSRDLLTELDIGALITFGIGAVAPRIDPCLGDLDADGAIDLDDLLILLGPIPAELLQPAHVFDLDDDGDRDGDDTVILLAHWGPCLPG